MIVHGTVGEWLGFAALVGLIVVPGLVWVIRDSIRRRRTPRHRPRPHGYEALEAQGVDTLRRRAPRVPAGFRCPRDGCTYASEVIRRYCPRDGTELVGVWLEPDEPWLDGRHRWHPGSPPAIDRGPLLPQEAYRNRVLPPDPAVHPWRDEDLGTGPLTLHDLRPVERRLGDA